MTMNDIDFFLKEKSQQRRVNRRNLLCGAAGTIVGVSLLRPTPAFADRDDDHDGSARCNLANPIRGGVVPFNPFGVPVHHNPLKPANQLAVAGISDPSQITDFDGFVGLTHIRGGGIGTNTETGATSTLAFQTDMGFGQGKFIGIDGRQHNGTFAFV
jgi:hypothetical protein